MRHTIKFVVIVSILMLAVLPAAAQVESDELEYDPTVCAGSTFLQQPTPDCMAMMEAFPTPDLEPIPQDRSTLSQYSFWRVGPDAVPTFDAPGGNNVGQIAAGFNFVNAINLDVDGWLQIEGGQWIQRDRATFTEPSYFTGVIFPEDGWEHEFAWVLDLSFTYVSERPGGEPSQDTGRFLQRYELINIFDTATDAEGWRWYMIGPNQWVKQTFVSKFQPMAADDMPEDATDRWVAVDLYEQTLVAYEGDKPAFATVIATGIPPTETNEGTFDVWARLARDGMSGSTGAPNAYALQSVPWVLYFDDDISIHGTYWHDLFGYRQSRGCVNLTISDARFVFEWMDDSEPTEDGEIMNTVYVHSTGEYGENVIRG